MATPKPEWRIRAETTRDAQVRALRSAGAPAWKILEAQGRVLLRPPPPPPPPARKPPPRARASTRVPPSKRVERERCTAAQLRPEDWLITNDGLLRVLDVEHTSDIARLLTNGSWWQCKPSTRFVRVRQSRRTVMRPDLQPEGEQ